MSDGITFNNGLPVRIESFASMDEKKRYKIVRRDNYASVPGDIITAIVETGECTMSIKIPGVDDPEIKTLSFGPDQIRIVRR